MWTHSCNLFFVRTTDCRGSEKSLGPTGLRPTKYVQPSNVAPKTIWHWFIQRWVKLSVYKPCKSNNSAVALKTHNQQFFLDS